MQGIYFNSSSILLLVIDVKVTKTTTSFLLFWVFVYIVTLLRIDIALNIAQVLGFILIFFYYLGNIDPSTWITFSTTALIFLGDLGLRLISRRKIVGFSFF